MLIEQKVWEEEQNAKPQKPVRGMTFSSVISYNWLELSSYSVFISLTMDELNKINADSEFVDCQKEPCDKKRLLQPVHLCTNTKLIHFEENDYYGYHSLQCIKEFNYGLKV